MSNVLLASAISEPTIIINIGNMKFHCTQIVSGYCLLLLNFYSNIHTASVTADTYTICICTVYIIIHNNKIIYNIIIWIKRS